METLYVVTRRRWGLERVEYWVAWGGREWTTDIKKAAHFQREDAEVYASDWESWDDSGDAIYYGVAPNEGFFATEAV